MWVWAAGLALLCVSGVWAGGGQDTSQHDVSRGVSRSYPKFTPRLRGNGPSIQTLIPAYPHQAALEAHHFIMFVFGVAAVGVVALGVVAGEFALVFWPSLCTMDLISCGFAQVESVPEVDLACFPLTRGRRTDEVGTNRDIFVAFVLLDVFLDSYMMRVLEREKRSIG